MVSYLSPLSTRIGKMMLWLSFVWCLLSSVVHVHGQSGFLSIDCGIPENSGYKDKVTHISYTWDAPFIDSGVNRNVSSDFMSDDVPDQFSNVRYFPNDEKRNCYTLKDLHKGSKYLIRASFMYGNYDGQNRVPKFNLYLGPNLWEEVNLRNNASHILRTEIIAVASVDFLSVCLENIGLGTPFISVLELRVLDDSIYSADNGSQPMVNESQSLVLFDRHDLGSTNGQDIRYAIDVFDRIWSAESLEGSEPFASADVIRNNSEDFQPPSAVMRTAVRPLNGTDVLYFNWTASDPHSQFYVFMHFAEIVELERKQVREFNICCDSCYGHSYRPELRRAFTEYTTHPLSGQDRYSCSFRKTAASTLPPILNAIEIYTVRKLSKSSTDIQDVEAMMNIKERYKVKKNWLADPCVPLQYIWEGLNCSCNETHSRIVSLDLASSGLSGEIADSLANLTFIGRLDLSSNNLTGPIPDFLADLPRLSHLNLSSNKLTGSIPAGLLQKSRKGLLTLSVNHNPNLCVSGSCQSRGRNLILITATVASAVAILLIALIIIWRYTERRRRATEPHHEEVSLVLDSRHFTYAEVVSMTNDFERVIGKGAFGTVYHGYMRDGTQVAVKMLSQPSPQGSKVFRTEAHLLMRVHHRNLASFMGYCDEGLNMALIYEYMAEGNLAEHLSERNASVLSWEERLRIALDAAQGLEYLHTGCKPPIVHRDVKTANILLNARLEAKLADFGLSKIFPNDGITHVSTQVMGTPGYVDPEYYITNKLNEKSDVYSFGVVLLQLITGQPAISKSSEPIHIVQWAGPILARGDIQNVVDPRLKKEYDTNSMWKASEIAMACTPSTSVQRVTMNDVVTELKECLAIEMARERIQSLRNEELDNKSGHSSGSVCMDTESESGPFPR